MAGLGSDYIQQQLLDQSITINDNLSAMREVLLNINKNTKGTGSNGNGGTPPPPGNGGRRGGNPPGGNPYRKAFNDIFGETKNFGRLIAGNNATLSSTVGSLTTSAGALSSAFGKIPGPVGLAGQALFRVAEIGGQVYQFMAEQLDMYNKLNSAGITLADGMISARKGAASAFLSVNEFSEALQRNSTELAAMEGEYKNGVGHFGDLLNSVQLAQDKLGIYGVSQQQLADLTAKNYKFEKMYNVESQFRRMNEQSSTETFVKSMTNLSRSVGKSVDELLKSFDNMSDTVDSEITQQALKDRFGFDDKKATEVNKAFNTVYAGMGEVGNTVQKIMASKNLLNALPEEYSNNFTQLYAQQMSQLEAEGLTDQKEIRKRMNIWLNQHSEQLDNEIKTQEASQNRAGADLLKKLKTQNAFFNDPANDPTPQMEELTSRLKNWFSESIYEPLNKFYIGALEGTASYFNNLLNTSDGFWDGLATAFRDGIKGLGFAMSDGLKQLDNIVSGWFRSLFGSAWDDANKGFEDFMNNLMDLPNILWNKITSWFNSTSEEKMNSITDGISSLYDGIVNGFRSLADMDFSFDSVKDSFMDAYNYLNDKLNSALQGIIDWWNGDDKPKEEPVQNNKKETPKPVVQPKKPPQPQATAKAEVTKPEKIKPQEEQRSSTVDIAKNQTQDDPNKILGQILRALESQNQNNNNIQLALRQIAENTEPARNV